MKNIFLNVLVLMAIIFLGNTHLSAEEKSVNLYEQTYATIDGTDISQAYFQQFKTMQAKWKFYHAKPPEEQEAEFEQSVRQDLLEHFLLTKKAKEINISVDLAKVEAEVANYDQFYMSNAKEQWLPVKPLFLPMYRQLLEQELYVAAYKKKVEDSVALSEEDVYEFYKNNLDKFTQPPQNSVSVIMLNVAPSAGSFVWQAMLDQANEIYKKLQDGEDFSNLAKLHSTHPSADDGGVLGFLHEGMIAKTAEAAIAQMEVGDVSKPMMLLDGITIVKLNERRPSIKHTFDEVKNRARQLATREAKESAWNELRSSLIKQANIVVNDNTPG